MSRGKHPERRFTTFTQPKGATAPDVLGVLPRRVAWTNKKADGKYRMLMQMPYPNIEQAACSGVDDPPHLEDYPTNKQIAEAKAMCKQCPIRRKCAAWGIAHEKHYIYGGLTAQQRDDIRERLYIQEHDPIHGANHLMNDDWKHVLPKTCEEGHGLDERDLFRLTNLVDDPYRHTYEVRCTKCWHDNKHSDAAPAMMQEKARKGNDKRWGKSNAAH